MWDWRRVWHVGEGDETCIQVLVGKPEGKNIVEDLGMDGRIILKWILNNSLGSAWTELICLTRGTREGLL